MVMMKEPVIFVTLFMEQFLYLSCRLLIVCVRCSVNFGRKLWCFGTYKFDLFNVRALAVMVYCQFAVVLAGCRLNDWEIRLWFQAGMLVFLITTFKQTLEAHSAFYTICTGTLSTWCSGCGTELTVDCDLVVRWRDACCMLLSPVELYGGMEGLCPPPQYVYRPLPVIDVVLQHTKLPTYTSLFMLLPDVTAA